jgi:flagellar protein FlaJ
LAEGASFDTLTTRRTLQKTKRTRPGEELVVRPHHQVMLPKGAKPVTVPLSPFQAMSWRVMGKFVTTRYEGNEELEDNLLKAHMRLRPEEYLAWGWMSLAIISGVCLTFGAVLGMLLFVMAWPLLYVILFPLMIIALPILFTRMVFFGLSRIYRGMPAGRAKKRGKIIDAKITGSMSFISAMASADVPIDVIFKELSRQPIYKEVAREAEWITRDTELLGVDILTAIRRAVNRTPSTKFQDFLQGVVTTSTSGGQLKPYFLVKAEQFEKEDKLDMRKKMETLGMLAESFVTVVVAFPLFLVVIMAIMALISKTGSGFVTTLLFAVVGLMIPMSQFGFIFVIWNMEQEA